jgi:hypothetical protein
MNRCEPNSHTYKAKKKQEAENKQIIPVTQGVTKPKKKSGITKLADVFISEDVSNVKSYIVQDIIVPSIKKGIIGAIDMILNGGNGSALSRRSSEPRVSYRKYYDDSKERRTAPPPKSRFDYDAIEYEYRGDAEAVLQQMRDIVEEYGVVTVGDMYEMARLEQPYTSNKYGWYSLNTAKTVNVGGKFVIDLPKAEVID